MGLCDNPSLYSVVEFHMLIPFFHVLHASGDVLGMLRAFGRRFLLLISYFTRFTRLGGLIARDGVLIYAYDTSAWDLDGQRASYIVEDVV